MKMHFIYPLFLCLCLFSVACFFDEAPEAPSDTFFNQPGWSVISNYPYNASLAAGFGIEATGKAYVGVAYRVKEDSSGGPSGTRDEEFWEYDPISNKWTRKKDFEGESRYYTVSFSIGDKGYLATGTEGSEVKYPTEFWEYDPIKDDWLQKGEFPGLARIQAVGFSIGDKGYIGFGSDQRTVGRLSDFWEYDPKQGDLGKWKQLESWKSEKDDTIYPKPRVASSSFSINGKGYVVSGIGQNNIVLKDLWEYNPSADPKKRWRLRDSIPQAVISGAAFSINGKGYVCCGQNIIDGRLIKDFWEYDPIKDEWKPAQTFLGLSRANPIAFSLQNKGYVGLGHFRSNFNDLNFLSDFFVYTSSSKK